MNTIHASQIAAGHITQAQLEKQCVVATISRDGFVFVSRPTRSRAEVRKRAKATFNKATKHSKVRQSR